MDAAIEDALARLAAEGIEVSAYERANVHATAWSEPYTWLRVVREFLAIKYCVQVR